MREFIILMFICALVFLTSIMSKKEVLQQVEDKCVAKHGEMPSNKVRDFCKTLLKFEPDTN